MNGLDLCAWPPNLTPFSSLHATNKNVYLCPHVWGAKVQMNLLYPYVWAESMWVHMLRIIEHSVRVS